MAFQGSLFQMLFMLFCAFKHRHVRCAWCWPSVVQCLSSVPGVALSSSLAVLTVRLRGQAGILDCDDKRVLQCGDSRNRTSDETAVMGTRARGANAQET